MYMIFDPDEWETVTSAENGNGLIGYRPRDPAEAAKIKADRLRRYEDSILAKADAIRALRKGTGCEN